MHKLVLIRHGESLWNLENRFTGWTDVELTATGVAQAKQAGLTLKNHGFDFDLGYTSMLRRAIHTLWHALDSMERSWLPVAHHWRLNERHYGALEGLNKADTAEKYGEEQVMIWRRSYDIPPMALEANDPRVPFDNPRYAGLSRAEIPLTECLKDTVARVLPYWNNEIVPAMRSGRQILICAHGNSLRGLIKHLDQISDADIVKVNIPNAQPLVYELDADMNPIRSYYLGDAAAIEAAIKTITQQGRTS